MAKHRLLTKHRQNSGDTIIEVLISIVIISVVITGAYAVANRGLQQGITASEHTTALKLAQGQIEALKFHEQQMNKQTFLDTFANAKNDNSFINFCLDITSKGPTDPAGNWLPLSNGTDPVALRTPGSPNYHATCSNAAKYYINISLPKNYAYDSVNQIMPVYLVTVRWLAIGGGTSQTQLFYRIGG